MIFNKLSNILGPIRSPDQRIILGQDLVSKSTKLFSDEGLVRVFEGRTIILPFLVRSLRKLERIIHEEMGKLSAYEVILPMIMKQSLFEMSGRGTTQEMFKFTDRKGRNYVLSPTHEEVITDLMATEPRIAEKSLPLRLFQISTKFRDEAHAKHGLIRAKEFIMKDLYCFDRCPEERNNSYREVCSHYSEILKKFKIPYACVTSKDNEKSIESHEFHFFSEIGDDLMICENCGHSITLNAVQEKTKCEKCSNTNVKITKGIEVGHTFNIGTHFSEKLNATFISRNGDRKYLEMSSYGIGVSRILGAAVEVLSTDDYIKWPFIIAPYLVCIIPPKDGSKENGSNTALVDIYSKLNHHLNGDVVIDDRKTFSVGKRLNYDKKLGFPITVVLGKSFNIADPKIEVHDIYAGEKHLISLSGTPDFILKRLSEM